MKKTKALVLLSGGLDSTLAAKILMEQGIGVVGLSFKSYFFDSKSAAIAAEKLGIPLKIVDFSSEHLKIVKSPKYGHGKAINPCIDCHALMLKKAKEIAGINIKEASFGKLRTTKSRYNFVATGEVLGERPMSQNKKSLDIIENESGLNGYLLRPLSAKSLKPTIPEQKGLIDRNKLLNIVGRSRKIQMELAEKWGIKNYPTPAGGCILTDIGFGKKIKDVLNNCPNPKENDFRLLKIGRHFWSAKNKIIIGRNHEENVKLKKLARKNDVLIEPKNFSGASGLIRNYGRKKISQEVLTKAKKLITKYSKKIRGQKKPEFKIAKK